MAASIQEIAVQKANSFSDHNVQVDPGAKSVSQNLQAPYAIKLRDLAGWGFDLPEFMNLWSPDYEALSRRTGLSKAQNQYLVQLMRQTSPILTKSEMMQSLEPFGIGESLGQGGWRLSIETDIAYEDRMRVQIGALIRSVEAGANVLNIQEQPYDGLDKRRMGIFEKVMKEHGYVSIARLKDRDVGIWVKEDLAKNFTKPSGKIGNALVKMVEKEPLRGCIIEDGSHLYINLHVDRDAGEGLVTKLITLKVKARDYSNKHNPRLSFTISGDMNLFKLNSIQQERLRNSGFVVEPVKGQEKFAVSGGTPTCEAYLRASPNPVSSSSFGTHSLFSALPQTINQATPKNSTESSQWTPQLYPNSRSSSSVLPSGPILSSGASSSSYSSASSSSLFQSHCAFHSSALPSNEMPNSSFSEEPSIVKGLKNP
ncbi:MAG: hypothetical protein K0R48_1289 [Gammaproteobacteria bacterium]|jgi:hypothetical protein|nr:hypothetical protein [Gammaproteobacteria bacterium]